MTNVPEAPRAVSGTRVLALLLIVYITNLVDRHIVGVLAAPIKSDLGMTDTTTVPKEDLVAWRQALAEALPSGTGGINVNTANRKVTVTVQWDDSRATGGGSTQQFVVETQL